MIDLNLNPTRPQLRTFGGILLPLFLTIIAAILYFRFALPFPGATLIVIGILLIPFGILLPTAFRPIYIIWMIAAFPIGWTISHVMLGLLYYAILTPLAVFMRLRGRDRLRLRRPSAATTYWRPRPAPRPRDHYFRQS